MATECHCQQCQLMCQTPCWPTPEEVEVLIQKGYGPQLMIEYRIENVDDKSSDIYVICPAIKGYEGKAAPYIFNEWCTFFEDSLCTLHDKKLKPFEGREADCKAHQPTLRKDVLALWNTPKGKEVVESWKEKFLKESA